jgi:hypothetical protein
MAGEDYQSWSTTAANTQSSSWISAANANASFALSWSGDNIGEISQQSCSLYAIVNAGYSGMYADLRAVIG